MTKIFKAMPFGSARREGQNRVQAVQGLDGALFIDTEDRRVERRLKVQADNIGGLLFKLEGHRWSGNHAPDEVEYRIGARHGSHSTG